jgi:hypothetical protein
MRLSARMPMALKGPEALNKEEQNEESRNEESQN